MIENIKYAQPYLRMYPADEAVFAEPVAQHRRHLMPLVSVDLSQVNPAWHGWIHVVNPYEPYDGLLGQSTDFYHSSYVQENWLAFRLDEHDRYHWLGDWRYFHLECDFPDWTESEREEDKPFVEELQRHYQKTEKAYQRTKAQFLEHGCLSCEWDEQPFNLVDQLGGNACFDNWASSGENTAVPLNVDDDEDVFPSTPEGKRFYFICQVDASRYGDYGAGIVLFFEPDSRTALLTFNWT